MHEGILNFGDSLGNYLIASSGKLPHCFVRAFGECPGYLIGGYECVATGRALAPRVPGATVRGANKDFRPFGEWPGDA